MPLRSSVLLIPTALYLLVEVAFASYLVEFLGSAPGKDQVLALEWWGRTLTGVALALLVLPPIIRRLPVQAFFPRDLAWGVAALGLAGCILAAHVGINRLVLTLTNATTAEERRLALIVQAGVQRIHAQEDGKPALEVNNTYLPAVLRETVAGRFVLAGLPFLLGQADGIEGRLVDALTEAAAQRIRQEIGPAEELFNRTYQPLYDGVIIKRYDAYVAAVNAARRGLQGRIRQADEDWQAYLSSLAANGLNHAVVPDNPRQRQAVSRQLRRQNPDFPPDWVPRRREDFDQVYADQVRARFRVAIGQLRLVAPAPDLEDLERLTRPSDFLGHRAVEQTWVHEVNARITDPDLRNRLNDMGPLWVPMPRLFERFVDEVYNPLVSDKIAVERRRLESAVAAYGAGGQYATEAYDAAKLMVVVPLALAFSIVGAVTHISKAFWLLLRSVGVSAGLAMPVVTAGLAAVLSAGLWTSPSPVLARPEVVAMARGLSASQETMLRSAIAIQHVLYPTGVALRRAVGRGPA